MISITKQQINQNKREITALAFNRFDATYVNPLNGKRDELTRTFNGFAHLRFTKVFERSSTGFEPLKTKDYKYNYIYYTTSTTNDKKTNFKDKVKRNLSDLCFNVRKEVLDNDFGAKEDGNFYFLVDTGFYFVLVSKYEARKNILDTHIFNGRENYKVRCPNRLEKKTTELKNVEGLSIEDFMLNWDAKYIQNVTYSKYRFNKGSIKAEVYKDGAFVAVKYYISTGALFDDLKEHGYSKSKDYLRVLANKNGKVKVGKFEIVLSRFVNDTIINNDLVLENPSTNHDSQESGYPLQYSSLKEIDNTVMVNQTFQSGVEEKLKKEEQTIFEYHELD